MNAQDEALRRLLEWLRAKDYRFIVPTPETHERVIRRKRVAQGVRDVLGWSLPFSRETLPGEMVDLLDRAGVLEVEGAHFRSRVRVASIGDALFLHSAFPTDAADSVFFGPDSYRFVSFLKRELAGRPIPENVIDIGAGSGVGGICVARMFPGLRPTLIDVNPAALRLARINAAANGTAVEVIEGSGVDGIEGPLAIAISNPPFLIDPGKRTYRDGGRALGAGLSVEWAVGAARKLAPDGRVLLYSGSAIVAGRDGLQALLAQKLAEGPFTLRYEEIDPDIFGEQLEEPGYEDVERIAAVGAVIQRLR